MPKDNSSKDRYKQKFRQEWTKCLELKDWLIEQNGDAFCKFCKSILNAKLHDLKAHALTKKHKTASEPYSKMRNLTEYYQPKERPHIKKLKQSSEAGLSLFVLNHCAIRSIDHLTNLCKNIFGNAEHAAQLQLHRSKCSAIIKNIFYPFFKESLRKDIGDAKYSLIIDESTDISIEKYLGISIKYYSRDSEQIITTFLSLETLENGTADGIVNALKKCLNRFNLKIEKMIALGTDNANVLVGRNTSVIQKLRAENSSIILIPCVCHSIQLATSAAAKEFLPDNLEFLLSETYNWFSKSSLRQSQYAMLYSAINDGKKHLKILQKSNTRWLSIESCVSRIVSQWIELTKHFELSRTKEKCFIGNLLFMEYTKEENLALNLKDISSLNKKFKSNDANPVKLLNDLCMLIESLVGSIIYPESTIDKLESDFVPHTYIQKIIFGEAF